jgi:hypothetical protein
MQSIFLEALITARDLVQKEGLNALEALIKDHELGIIETTAILPEVETR